MRGRSERGASISVWSTLVVTALFLMSGLAVDGGAHVAAARRAEVAAAAAARAGSDAGAASRVSGTTDRTTVRRAALEALRRYGVEGEVSIERGGVLRVRTSVPTRPVFLNLLGISRLVARGQAEALLTPR